MMKVKVIDVAINEINEKTDIRVSYNVQKDHSNQEWWGKKLIFKIEKIAEEFWKLPSLDMDLVGELLKFGITENRAKQFVSVYPKEYILSQIWLVKQKFDKWQIKNIASYLASALENDYATPVSTEYQIAIDKKKEASQVKQEKIEQQQQAEKSKKEVFYQQRDQRVEEWMKQQTDEQHKILLSKFEESIKWSPIYSAYKKQGIDGSVTKRVWYNYLWNEFLSIHENDYESYRDWVRPLF